MKITIKKLRQIVMEEVLKEELAPEIAAPAIAAMLKGMQAETTSDVFGAAFDELYGEGALEGEAERQAGMEEPAEEDFPTDYQAGGAYGDRPRIGFEEGLEEIIREEVSKIINEDEDSDQRVVQLVERASDSFMKIFSPEELSLIADRDNRDMFVHYLFENIQLRLDARSTAGGGLGGPGGKARHPSAEERQAAHVATGFPLAEDMASHEDIAALRQQIGDMSYEIERMLVALIKAGYSMEDIMQMASELKRMDPHPADVQVAERKLSKSEKKEKEKVVKGMKKSKKDFQKRYGDDAESVMYATATKMAKEKKE